VFIFKSGSCAILRLAIFVSQSSISLKLEEVPGMREFELRGSVLIIKWRRIFMILFLLCPTCQCDYRLRTDFFQKMTILEKIAFKCGENEFFRDFPSLWLVEQTSVPYGRNMSYALLMMFQNVQHVHLWQLCFIDFIVHSRKKVPTDRDYIFSTGNIIMTIIYNKNCSVTK